MKAEICRFDDETHRSMRRSINDVGKKPEIKGRMKGRGREITETRVQGENEERIQSPSAGLGCFLYGEKSSAYFTKWPTFEVFRLLQEL